MATLLAGPMVRRAEPGRIWFWFATDGPAAISVSLFRYPAGGGPRQLAGQSAPPDQRTGRLGANFCVHLVPVPVAAGAWPTGTDSVLFHYDATVDGDDLAALGLLSGADSIAYPGEPLPGFRLHRDGDLATLLHGSCRRLHSDEPDAYHAIDDILKTRFRDAAARPAALFLTGDQIYADNVGAPLIRHLTQTGDTLMGWPEFLPDPVRNVRRIPVCGRGDAFANKSVTGFTSSHGENHLATFGEYAAHYLAAWSPAGWPAAGLPKQPPPELNEEQQDAYAEEWRQLETAQSDSAVVRRVHANIPAYMTFDDHEVTDDWNLTQEWMARVQASPSGRRIVANGLAAFWAFQAWGNDPDRFDPAFIQTIEAHLAGPNPPGGGDPFDRAMWDFHDWGYVTPTKPAAIVLDSRTQRHFDTEFGPPRLMNGPALDWLRTAWTGAGLQAGDPVILVTSTPIIGFDPVETGQKIARLVPKLATAVDFESWIGNRKGFGAILDLLNTELQPGLCVVLSGDVHYSFNSEADFFSGGRGMRVVQLVASGLRNTASAEGFTKKLGKYAERTETRAGPLPRDDAGFTEWLQAFWARGVAAGWEGPEPTAGGSVWYNRIRGRVPAGRDNLVTTWADVGEAVLLPGDKVRHLLHRAPATGDHPYVTVLDGTAPPWIEKLGIIEEDYWPE